MESTLVNSSTTFKYAKGPVTAVQRTVALTNGVNSTSKVLGATGKTLGVAGTLITTYNAAQDKVITLGETTAIGLSISTNTTGWPGATYGLVDFGFALFSDESLSGRIQTSIDNNYYYELINFKR